MSRDRSKEAFKDYICKPFCSYFRENSKEDLACQAALVVVELANSGRLDMGALSVFNKGVDDCWQHDRDLDKTVCSQCSFWKEDCDFQSEENWDHAEPCGGYKVLSLLKTTGSGS
jgi:hypothetical protein